MSEKKEYIERGALKEKAEIIRKKMLIEKHEPFTIDIMNDFADLLDQYAKDIPAADVEPVVQGEWMPPETDGFKTPYDKRWTCSNCKKSDDISYRFSKFCPSCGAHMERSGSGE